MEPGVRTYLIRIVNTLSLGLLWMVVNSTLGIMYAFAYVDQQISLGNILFYIWFVISLVAYLIWVYRLWSKPIDFDE